MKDSQPFPPSRHGTYESPQQRKVREQATRMSQRNELQEKRRLSERERISGEIRTPTNVTHRRVERVREPQEEARKPVSSSAVVPERRFSGRVILMVLASLVVISFMVPTARSFYQQYTEVSALEDSIEAAETEQAQLQSDLQRWEDPDYVRAQARERMNLVTPGETRYHVSGLSDELSEDSTSGEGAGADSEQGNPTWSEQLVNSVQESAQ